MWRWVTRGLVLTVCASLLAPALFAQTTFDRGDLDSPDPARHAVRRDPRQRLGSRSDADHRKIELYVDDQFHAQADHESCRASTSIEAFPNYPGIHTVAPGIQTGFLASRFTNGPHTVERARLRQRRRRARARAPDDQHRQHASTSRRSASSTSPMPAGIYNASRLLPGLRLGGRHRRHRAHRSADRRRHAAGRDVRRPASGRRRRRSPTSPARSSAASSRTSTRRASRTACTCSTVRAIDRLGMSQLIGRRTVQIINNDAFLKPFGYHRRAEARRRALRHTLLPATPMPIVSPPINPRVAHHAGPRLGARPRHAPRHRPRRVRRAADRRRSLDLDRRLRHSIFGALRELLRPAALRRGSATTRTIPTRRAPASSSRSTSAP